MKKYTFYFKHDYYARQDSRMADVIKKYGMFGVGLYWCLVEILHERNGYILESDLDEIAYQLRLENTKILLDFVLNSKLFVKKQAKISSKSVLRRLEESKIKSLKSSESALKRWSKVDANALPPQSDRNAIREDKIREDKIREDKKEINKEKTEKGFSSSILFLVDVVNRETGKNCKPTKKAEAGLTARLREGFTLEEIERAVVNASKSDFHRKENLRFITPEFFTRSEKINNWKDTVKLMPVKVTDDSQRKEFHNSAI